MNTDEAVAVAAGAVSMRYPQSGVTALPLRQRGRAWVATHTEYVAACIDHEDPTTGERDLLRALMPVMDGLARKIRAGHRGYSAEDEAFYATERVLDLLPFVLTGDRQAPVVDNDRRGAGDPAEGGGWLASVMDVHTAWCDTEIGVDDRALVVDFIEHGEPAGLALGMDGTETIARVRRIVSRMVDTLGGYRPQGEVFKGQAA